MARWAIFWAAIGAVAVTARAYDRPETARHGVSLALRGLEEPYEPSNKWIRVARRPSAQPVVFAVDLSNRTDKAVSGELRVKMPADWRVTCEGGDVTLAKGEGRRIECRADALSTVVAGLYPVHAEFRMAGCSPLSVVSVFQAQGAKPKWNRELPNEEVKADEAGLLADSVALSAGGHTFAWRGIRCRVDGLKPQIVRVERKAGKAGEEEIIHYMRHPRHGEVPLRARVKAGASTLRIAWDMPGVKRGADGTPRYTHLSLGPGDEPAHRVYAGLGNVLENPRRFSLHAEAVRAGTRFTGCDYASGFSFVQATDVFPDRVVCDRDARLLAQVVHGDATFTLIASDKGAFAAARRYADVCGYAKSAGHDALVGRMCLDAWSGDDYAHTALELEDAARYGMTDAVFVMHAWQRYGYDYRLPDICPPAGDVDAFRRMVAAAQTHGILFCPHDNYTDIYPDSALFDYDVVRFNPKGEPQTAWLNPGRNALSYKWLDHAILPAVRRNARQMAECFAPDGVFIDVLASQPPVDHYDRQGNYCDKACSVRSWNAAFDAYRAELGKPHGPMISETGHDALVGHVDAGEADHCRGEAWVKPDECATFEKVPWEDMVTHGRMILYAGGLATRYAMKSWKQPGNEALHGYASDDYLGFTVLAGRMPMCEGPCSRAAVKTYWLTHDICASLGRARFEAHEFADGSIRRQRTRFSNGGSVRMNRDEKNDWAVDGHVLPPFGFWATAPGVEAGVVRIAGQRAAYAKAEGTWFVDARPRPRHVGRRFVAAARPVGFRAEGATAGRIALDWRDLAKEPTCAVYGFASCWDAKTGNRISRVGSVRVTRREIEVRLPKDAAPGTTYDIRYGLARSLPIRSENVYGEFQRDGIRQVSAGRVRVVGGGKDLVWEPPAAENAEQERRLEINVARQMVDFGGIKTDGAFRFAFGKGALQLTPLPGSGAFRAEIDLAAFGARGRRIDAVEAVEAESGATACTWSQEGDRLKIEADGRAFAYRVVSDSGKGMDASRLAKVDAHGVMRWCDDGTEVARFGVNYYAPFTVDYKNLKAAGLDIRRVMRDDVAHFRRLGLDCIRLHTFDREFSSPDGAFEENEHVALLDELISICASNGIQTVLTPIAWWGGAFAPGETRGFSNRFTMEQMTSDREAWRIQARFLREFAEHRNRVTGHRYGDDPAILAFELINEPHYPDKFSDDELVAYIDTLAEGLRSGGTTKPIFYNSWHGRHAAVTRAKVEGETNSTYPMGLCNHHERTGNLLELIRPNELTTPPEDATRAKMVYEFDTADTSCGYLYPALARSFRHQGIQVANQFQYDALPLAPDNRDWETHYLNLVYTPAKALSFAIAAKAFHVLPRGCGYPNGPHAEMTFPPFRVDARRNLSEYVTAEDYWYTATPLTPPPDVARLRRIYGVGRSSVASCSGEGIYFLDKVEEGVWRLQLYPDVFQVADPYTGWRGVKRIALDAELDFSVRLPDLGDGWSVKHVVGGEGAAETGATRGASQTLAGRLALAEAKDCTVRLRPGDYVVLAKGKACTNLPPAPRYVIPSLVADDTPRVFLGGLPQEWGTVKPLPFALRSRKAKTMTLLATSRDDRAMTVSKTCAAAETGALPLPAGDWDVRVCVAGASCAVTSATQRVRTYARLQDWPLFKVADALKVRFEGRHRSTRYETKDDAGRRAVGIAVKASNADGCGYAGFRVPFDVAAQNQHFPLREKGAEILVHARAARDGERLEIVFSDADGKAWGLEFPLTKDWKTHRLKVSDFWPHWNTRVPKTAKANPTAFVKVNVGFGAWLFGKTSAESHTFEISDIRFAGE